MANYEQCQPAEVEDVIRKRDPSDLGISTSSSALTRKPPNLMILLPLSWMIY